MGNAAPILLLFIVLVVATGCSSQGDVEKSVPETGLITPTTTPAPIRNDPVTAARVNDGSYTDKLESKYKACIDCHGDVKPFHTTGAIGLIDEKKGLQPRLCLVCHGQKVHDIHISLLNEKTIICDTCHTVKGEFTKPSAGEGQLLVCEACHAKGNYITIHIEGRILEGAEIDEQWIKTRSGNQCSTCHFGEYETIHQRPLESWKEGIESVLEETRTSPPSPLNISYI